MTRRRRSGVDLLRGAVGRVRRAVHAVSSAPQLWMPRKRVVELDYAYQRRFITKLPRNGVILDLGSGHNPLPQATLLAERHVGTTAHRQQPLTRDFRPLVVLDIHALPFRDKGIDYVYCSHVLEHVDDPIRACREIMRVAKAGYIETPTRMKDILFGWAADLQHKWHVVRVGQRLCFFEYDTREQQGVRSPIWRDSIFSRWYHPNQDLYFANLEIFNTIFEWEGSFDVVVFSRNGDARS